jgi:hypothetical protein
MPIKQAWQLYGGGKDGVGVRTSRRRNATPETWDLDKYGPTHGRCASKSGCALGASRPTL